MKSPMGYGRIISFFLLWSAPGLGAAAAVEGTGFSAERAFSHVRVLAHDIGPRKIGSESETETRRYLTGVLEGFGLEVEVLEVGTVSPRPDRQVQVNSANLLARLPGRKPEAILIGAHFDSRDSEVPGALDDASGVAVVLEAARVLAANPPDSTIWFAIFTAEEDGCLGSRHFVRHQDVSPLKLAITLDPVGRGKVFLAPFPEPPSLEWNRALYRIQRRKGLHRVLLDPLFVVAPRFIRVPHLADHVAFLEQGIPALNLSSQFELWEYHTRWDRLDRVERSTLATAGELVLGLVEDFDHRRPSAADDPHHLILRFPWVRVFLAGRVLYAVSTLTILVVLLMGYRALRWRHRTPILLPGLRVLLVVGFLVTLGLSGLFLTEVLSEAWTGFRFPWFARQGLSLAMAVSLTTVTAWLALRAAPRILPVVRPEPYLVAAGTLLTLMSGTALAFRRPEIAFLFIPSLMAVIACFWVPGYRIRFLLVIASALHLPGLVHPESYRAAIRFAGLDLPIWVGYSALVLVLLPLALAVVGLTYHQDFLGIFWWRVLGHPNTLAAGLVAFVVFGATWLQFQSYDRRHRRTVRVREVVDLDRSETRLQLDSQENLKDVRIQTPDSGTLRPSGRKWSRDMENRPDLLDLEVFEEPAPEPGKRVVRIALAPDGPADGARIRFRIPGGFLVPEPEPGREEGNGWLGVPELEWRYVHQIHLLEDRFELRPATPDAPLTVELEAEFAADLLDLEWEAPHTVFFHRNRVRAVRILEPGQAASGFGADAGGVTGH